MLDKITNMNSIFIIMSTLLVLILTFTTVTINHVLAIATIGGNSNNMTRYIDPEGRFSIDYPIIWTGVHVTNRFQDMLESGQPPYTALIIDMLPTNVSDPAVIANTYKMGFSIPQNVECVKYQVEGQKACSYMIKITRPNGGTNLEGEQIFSHVNDKMFMFTMVAEQGNFSSYLPIFQSIMTSFRSPPDTSRPSPQQAPFNPAVCPPGTVQSSTNQCTPINPGMLLPYFNSRTCPSGTVQTGPGECTQKSNLLPPGSLLPQPYQQSPSYQPPLYQRQPYYNTLICPPGTVQTSTNQCITITPGTLLPQPYQRQPYYNTLICPLGTVQTGPTECTTKSNLVPPGTLLPQPYQQSPSYQLQPGQCDQTLWNHVYNPARLQVVDQCKTVSGTIVSIIPEPDGDYHIRLRVDPQFASMINSANINGQSSALVLEPICQNPVTQPDAIAACANFHQSINIPVVGTHVTVTGSYVLDLQHGGWAEIHPVSSIYTP
jgi:hypothetical protein